MSPVHLQQRQTMPPPRSPQSGSSSTSNSCMTPTQQLFHPRCIANVAKQLQKQRINPIKQHNTSSAASPAEVPRNRGFGTLDQTLNLKGVCRTTITAAAEAAAAAVTSTAAATTW
jgi:hypothetical protein